MYLKTLYHFYTPLFRPGRSPRELAHFIADASKFSPSFDARCRKCAKQIEDGIQKFRKVERKEKVTFSTCCRKFFLSELSIIFSISKIKIEKLILNLISTNLIESFCTIIIFQQTITVIIQIVIWEIPSLISCNNSWNWKTLVHVVCRQIFHKLDAGETGRTGEKCQEFGSSSPR